MARKEEILFVVPFEIFDNKGNFVIRGEMEIPAVSIEQAENRVAYHMVRPRKINPKAVYPGYTIEFGDTKTKDGRYIHAPEKPWQLLQKELTVLGIRCSNHDAIFYQKYYKVGKRNAKEIAKIIAEMYR